MKITGNYCNKTDIPRFGAGKTKFYTDFDGTYFPFEQYRFEFKDPDATMQANDMYGAFKSFMKKAGDKFSVLITTGRTQFEMLSALWALDKSKVDFPEPDGYVLMDGSRETDRVDDFMSVGPVMFFHDDNPSRHDKLNQTKKAVKEIIDKDENDLIIVAGNDYNDKNMLSPLNYIDLLGVNVQQNEPAEKILENEEVLNAIQKLPLVSVIAGNQYSMSDLIGMKEILDKKGIHKIFVAKDPKNDLLECAKQGMRVHAQNNEEYKTHLGVKLYGEIFGK